MRSFLTWLMVFGVLAGLNLRALSADGSCIVCFVNVENCCKNAPSTSQEKSQDSDSKKSPADHEHHHGCCSHVLPLAAMNESNCKFGIPTSFLLVARHESEVAPDGPFLGSEKPPLI
ncbi:MAG: hypothetical protein ABI162_10695 [Luteolibacter sp.]